MDAYRLIELCEKAWNHESGVDTVAREIHAAFAALERDIDFWKAETNLHSEAREAKRERIAALEQDIALLYGEDEPVDSDFQTKEGWRLHTTLIEKDQRIAELQVEAKRLKQQPVVTVWTDKTKEVGEDNLKLREMLREVHEAYSEAPMTTWVPSGYAILVTADFFQIMNRIAAMLEGKEGE